MAITKRVICIGADGQTILDILEPISSVVEAMTGDGGMVPLERIDYEVSKYVAAGVAEAVALAFFEGVTAGGLTENEAIERISAKDASPGTVSRVTVEFTDLPSDRYFRDAWEWSG